MHATAVVNGKIVRFKLSPALARAHRENRGNAMTEGEAVGFVEARRRARALCRAKPYRELPRREQASVGRRRQAVTGKP